RVWKGGGERRGGRRVRRPAPARSFGGGGPPPIPHRPSSPCGIAIAQHQQARSFELRAALTLAKLYRTDNRDADAHAVLMPAVEGFPPTQQFPELTEAQTLLSALSP